FLGVLQLLREPGRRAARHVGRNADHGGARRTRHARGSGAGRRGDRLPEKLCQRLHEALAAHSGRRLHRRHPLRAARDPRRLPQPAALMPRATLRRTAVLRGERPMHNSRLLRVAARLTLVALALPLLLATTTGAQSGPTKIGMLAPLTGPFAATGKDMVNGTELYLDEIGRQMGGRKIELIVE